MGLTQVKIKTLKNGEAYAIKYLYNKYDYAIGFTERKERGKLVVDITMDKANLKKENEVIDVRDMDVRKWPSFLGLSPPLIKRLKCDVK
jgi:hypothetical protein